MILILDYYVCGVSQVQPLSVWVPQGSPGFSIPPKTHQSPEFFCTLVFFHVNLLKSVKSQAQDSSFILLPVKTHAVSTLEWKRIRLNNTNLQEDCD